MAMINILIVEDEYITALDLKINLISNGFNAFDIVATGEDAVRVATESSQVDLILMDINLKGDMDGIEAATKIKAEKNVPIVFVTGYSYLEKSDLLKEVKHEGFLFKPVTKHKILDVIKNLGLN